MSGPVVVAGESLIDRVVAPDGSVSVSPGGGPFNAARALARLEVLTAFLGRISTDAFGEQLLARLRDDGVDVSLVVRTPDPTLVATAQLDSAGVAHYRFDAGPTAASGLLAIDAPEGLPGATRALHVGTLGLVLEPTASTIEALVTTARDDVLVLCDPNVRPDAIADPPGWRRRLDRILARCDVLRLSTDDLARLEPDSDPSAATRRLLRAGPQVVLLTAGSGPIRIITPADTVTIAVPQVTVVDTVGAGDAFGAGFLAAWLRGERGRAGLGDLEAVVEAARLASWVGALTTARSGAEPPTIDGLRAAGSDW